MADEIKEPRFEVVDEDAELRSAASPKPRVIVLRGWKAAVVAAPLIAAATALLLALAGLIAAGLVVGGTLLGAGLLARKVISTGSSSKKKLSGRSGAITKR